MNRPTETELLFERIERIEALTTALAKRNFALKVTLVPAIAVLLVLASIGRLASSQSLPNERFRSIEAQAFIVVDSKGATRALLGNVMGSESTPGFFVKDEDGIVRIALFASKEGGAHVDVSNRARKQLVGMISTEVGAAIGIDDKNGVAHVLLGTFDPKAEVLALLDTDRKPRAQVSIDVTDQAAIGFGDKTEQTRAEFGTDHEDAGRLSLKDGKGVRIFSRP
jgi:hypothetical protein